MKTSLKIAICLMTAAATVCVSPAVGEQPANSGVQVKSRVLGGPDALAFDAEATREQVAIWGYLEDHVPVLHEIQIETHAGRIPEAAVPDEILGPSGHGYLSGDALNAGFTDLFAAAAPAGGLGSVRMNSGNEHSPLSEVRLPLIPPELDRAAEVTLIDHLDGIHWPILLAAIGIVAVRMGAWRVLNQALFLATAKWEGVTVVASSRSGRRRRSSRSSRSRWAWRTERSDWVSGARPSRRRTRQHSRSRRRSKTRPSSGSARPSYRRGGREYVVSDVVFTTNSAANSAAVSTPTAARPHPQVPLLTYSDS